MGPLTRAAGSFLGNHLAICGESFYNRTEIQTLILGGKGKSMKRWMSFLLPVLMLCQPAWAAANPSTGDHNVVTLALIGGGIALALILIVLFTGKKKK